MRGMKLLFLAAPLIALSTAFAQPRPVTFEVASIHAVEAVPGRMVIGIRGGPGTKDPTNFVMEALSLRDLTMTAFNLAPYEITVPDWMASSRFTVTAKVPAGATKDDLKVMLRNLLEERFQLKVHHEKKQMSVYDLVIGRDGPKFQTVDEPPSPDPDAAAAQARTELQKDKDGFPVLWKGASMAMANGKARLHFEGKTVDYLAQQVSFQLRQPVKNSTGLTGTYDFQMFWDAAATMTVPSGESSGGAPTPGEGPTLQEALSQQLGLRLVSKKDLVDVVIVDHCEKVPSAN